MLHDFMKVYDVLRHQKQGKTK